MKNDKFKNFIIAFGATRLMLIRANELEFWIEALVLYCSLIDGCLRTALILKNQLDSKTSKIDDFLISQEGKRKFFTEKQIFRMAFDKKIIGKRLFSKITRLYEERNAIVHRFFLTNVQYFRLVKILPEYEIVFQKLSKIVYNLEGEQIEKGVGMTKSRKSTDKENKKITRDILKKIDSKYKWKVD